MTQDWICSVKWVQATATDGAWHWTVWLVDEVEGQDKPVLTKLEEGTAFWKLTVYVKVAVVCRKHGLRFRPNIRGTIDVDADEETEDSNRSGSS